MVAGAGLVGLTNYLLPPAPPKQAVFEMWWDERDNDKTVWYEFWSTTDLSKKNNWYLKCRVQGTNHIVLPKTNGQEFFTVRAGITYITGPTNKPVTNWMYSGNIKIQ